MYLFFSLSLFEYMLRYVEVYWFSCYIKWIAHQRLRKKNTAPSIAQEVAAFFKIMPKCTHVGRYLLPGAPASPDDLMTDVFQTTKDHKAMKCLLKRQRWMQAWRAHETIKNMSPSDNPHSLATFFMISILKAQLEAGCSITKIKSFRNLHLTKIRPRMVGHIMYTYLKTT